MKHMPHPIWYTVHHQKCVTLAPVLTDILLLCALHKMRIEQSSDLKKVDLILAQNIFEFLITHNKSPVIGTLQVMALDVVPNKLNGVSTGGLLSAKELLQRGGDIDRLLESGTSGGFRSGFICLRRPRACSYHYHFCRARRFADAARMA
eukprot:c12902_g1_i1 orf=887-1333(+)